MSALITITVPLTCTDYSGEVKNMQEKIVNYFGNRHATVDENYPTVYVHNCEINESDLAELYQNSYKGTTLTVIINNNSKQRQGDFICLEPK